MNQDNIILNDVSETQKELKSFKYTARNDYRNQGSRHGSRGSGEEENDLQRGRVEDLGVMKREIRKIAKRL